MKAIDTETASMFLGLCRSMTQRYCKRLGFEKTGRDYQLTDSMMAQIRKAMAVRRPGRPRKK